MEEHIKNNYKLSKKQNSILLKKSIIFATFLMPIAAISAIYTLGIKSFFPILGITIIFSTIGLFLIHDFSGIINKGEEEIVDLKNRNKEVLKASHRFVVDMVIELRRPLHGIIGTKQLCDVNNMNEEQKSFFEIIDFCSSYMAKQLERIQFYSENESQQAIYDDSPMLLNEIINSSINQASTIMGSKDIRLSFNIADNVPSSVIGKPEVLNALLSEILENAVKYTFKGEVKLNVELDPQDEDILVFSIQDTGPGISSKQQKELFKAFQFTDDTPWNERGSGLGLSIAKTLVNSINGNIWIESSKENGTTISFTFPITPTEVTVGYSKAPNEPITPLPLQEDRFEISSSNARVLVVDDEPFARTVISSLLGKMGYSCDQMDNGEEAVERAKTKDYDLIFMDIQMPVMDGWEATQEIIKNSTDHIPAIIALTSHTRPTDKKLCQQVGMRGFISKPIKKSELESIIINCNIEPDIKKVDVKKSSTKISEEVKKDNIQTEETYYELNGLIDLDSLYNYYGEDLEACKEILFRSYDSVESSLSKIEIAIKEQDFTEVAFQCHQMKGNLSYMMCPSGVGLCTLVEKNIRNKNFTLESITENYKELLGLTQGLKKEVQAITSSPADDLRSA